LLVQRKIINQREKKIGGKDLMVSFDVKKEPIKIYLESIFK